jgi:Predicted dithiol-disulfide isomerase involved in polyketide biosynthesis
MPKIEVFYDHTCPYCFQGLASFTRLVEDYPQAEIAWCPVEAHPKVEEPEHVPYADLAVIGAFFAQDYGIDLAAYNERVFDMYFNEHQQVDDPRMLAEAVKPLGIDTEAFVTALMDGTYEKALAKANRHAYITNKVWAVPSFVCGNKRLDAVGGVGVTEEQLAAFLQDCCG